MRSADGRILVFFPGLLATYVSADSGKLRARQSVIPVEPPNSQKTSSSTPSPSSPVNSVTPSHSSSTSSSSHSSTISSTTSTSSNPSSTPRLSLNRIANMTTCTSGNVTWTYSGPDSLLVLRVDNSSTTASTTSDSTTVYSSSLEASSDAWIWSPVNVTQGWYQFQASVSNISSLEQFYVINGTNTSCLSTPSLPINDVTSGTSSNTGAIVGGVVGGVVGLLVIAAALYLVYRRRKRTRNMTLMSDGRRTGKWGSLSSADWKRTNNAYDRSSMPRGVHATSSTAVVSSAGDVHMSELSTPVGTEEDAAYVGEKDENDKSGERTDNHGATLPSLQYSSPRSQATSSRTSDLLNDDNDGRHASTHFIRQSNESSFEDQARRLRSSMNGTIYARPERFSTSALPSASPILAVAEGRGSVDDHVSPTVEATTVARTASYSRRTQRKPVPHYDIADLGQSLDTNVQAYSTIAAGRNTVHSETHNEDIAPQAVDIPQKAFFGDSRPLHYLIPDPPPAARG